MVIVLEREPVSAPGADVPALRELEALLARLSPSQAQILGPNGERMGLPESVMTLLTRLVGELARGAAVTIVPLNAELTTQQAADLLNVSRPFLIKLVESGEIPFHRTGSHRRIRLDDVMAYREQRSRARRAALAEMAREAQEMELYE